MTLGELFVFLGFKIDKKTEKEAEHGIDRLKDLASRALGAIGIGFSVAGITSVIKECVALSSTVEEMQNKFDVVFQGMTEEVEAWAQTYANAIGRNKNDIKTYLADQQNLLVGFGMSRQEGAELSKQMTTLALDLASFANLDEASAVNNMTKAIMGESEAAKSLGAVLNDYTREQAMLSMGLTGSYDKLDQLTKMQVNYQAILAQSPDAIGDCERSMGSYESTVKRFNSTLKEVKTIVGQFFMPTFQKVLAFGARGISVLRDGAQKVSEFAAKVGGAEKIIAVLGTTIGITLGIVNFRKIADGIKLIGKGLGGINLKLFAIAAVVLLVTLAVQDFITFMNGGSSVIGAALEKAGVDTEKFRENAVKIWRNLRAFLSSVWLGIKNVAIPIFQGIWKSIEAVFKAVSGILRKIAPQIADFFDLLANGEVKTDEWVKLGEAVAKIAAVILSVVVALKVLSAVMTIVNLVMAASPITWIILGIVALIVVIVLCIKHWDDIKAAASAAWDWICGIWSSAAEWFNSKIIQPIVKFFSSLWRSITTTVGNIKESIVSGFQAAIEWITSLPGKALQWGKDIILGIVNGIRSAIGKVGDAAKGIADKIKSFLGFSEPEDGPLSDFHTYMPDMIDLMSQGIERGKRKVTQALESLTGDMSVIAQANIVNPNTLAVAGAGNSVSRTITQNVNINNQFNGDRAGQEKSSQAMDKAADDSTSEMARAIAFAK